MEKNLANLSQEELIQSLIQETVDINHLTYEKSMHRAAFLEAIKTRPNLLSKLNQTTSKQLMKYAIEQNPRNFIYLEKSQYSDELAQTFLYSRLISSNNKPAESTAISVQKSLDEKIVFIYSHTTQDGEEFYYLDRELQVPLSLKASIKITLKLRNAIELIERLDTHITQLGELKIKTAITDIVDNQFKAYLSEFIDGKKIGYYTLCNSLSEVENGFKEVIEKSLEPYGFTVSSFMIKQLAIPRDIQNKIENLSFEIRQRRADVEADSEFSKISLENYEAKLAIEAKYPDTEHTLTEYEKDLALKRYLTKIGREKTETVDHSIDIQAKVAKTDKTIEKTDDIIPEIEKPANKFKRNFIVAAIICGIISFIVLCINVAAGMIVLGVMGGIFGIIAALNTEKFADQVVESAYQKAENANTNAPINHGEPKNE